MSTRPFGIDNTNTARLGARIFTFDSGNAARQAKRIFVIDSANSARLIYQAVRTATQTAGLNGNIKGYQRANFGTLTADISGPGTAGLSIFAWWNNSTGPTADLAIDGFGADPGQSWFTTATANGTGLASSAATYTFAGTRSTWSWSPATWAMAASNTYTLTLS